MFAMLACITSSMAKPRFKSINNYGNSTTIVLEEKEGVDREDIRSGVFYNNGKQYEAKSISVDSRGGKSYITLKFKRCTRFENTRVSVNINGREENIVLRLGGLIH